MIKQFKKKNDTLHAENDEWMTAIGKLIHRML